MSENRDWHAFIRELLRFGAVATLICLMGLLRGRYESANGVLWNINNKITPRTGPAYPVEAGLLLVALAPR